MGGEASERPENRIRTKEKLSGRLDFTIVDALDFFYFRNL